MLGSFPGLAHTHWMPVSPNIQCPLAFGGRDKNHWSGQQGDPPRPGQKDLAIETSTTSPHHAHESEVCRTPGAPMTGQEEPPPNSRALEVHKPHSLSLLHCWMDEPEVGVRTGVPCMPAPLWAGLRGLWAQGRPVCCVWRRRSSGSEVPLL